MKTNTQRCLRRCAVAAAVALCLANHGQAANIVVKSTAEGSVAGTCTLQDAIIAVNTQISDPNNSCGHGDGNSDTIYLTLLPVYPATITLTAGTVTINGADFAIDVTQAVKIVGPTDANGQPEVTLERSGAAGTANFGLVFADANLTIDGLALRNGNSIDGGAIRANTFVNVALSNSVVSGNAASVNGGGIYAVVGGITLSHVTISGNQAGNRGGGVYAVPGTVAIDNSTISGNSALQGAGICTNNGNISITNSSVSGNSASGKGGGVYTQAGTVQIHYSTISGNSAAVNGGGIRSADGPVSLDHSTLSANSANAAGGGISLYAMSVQASYSTFNGNSAATHGGAIYAGQTAAASLTNSTISGNTAGQSGGGIYANTAELNYATVYANQSTASGSKGAGVYVMTGATANASIIAGSIGFDDLDAKNGAALSGNYNIIGSSGVSTPANDINCASGIHLGPLANFGGLTKTLPLLSGSCAIDAASANPGVATDQRGLARPAGSGSIAQADVGAFEKQSAADPDFIFIDGFGPTGSD